MAKFVSFKEDLDKKYMVYWIRTEEDSIITNIGGEGVITKFLIYKDEKWMWVFASDVVPWNPWHE